ncbi:FMN reductase [Streptacidiphilus pinicola]|uniref:FMN reductase n=1 Tax=Streptacidiphilus pinicola TaxID=2219663 RepID=A0A2X0IDR2_9ACTN|nr:NAD(P)H-dependent oxidoreductase [Streptacidiphilus pinicola]RAG81753.1 FMN reductase [Streptacidiphilus pinicola]
MTRPARIVALCGSTRTPSTTERALGIAAAHARSLGAQVDFFSGSRLLLPHYGTPGAPLSSAALDLLTAVASADGLLLGSPCYHGSVSGLLKNALDHLEELRDDASPYLDGRAVGCIAVGRGTQGPANTLRALRDIVHALRGWPTPLGVTVDSAACSALTNHDTQDRLKLVARQVATFATGRRALSADLRSTPAVT